MVLSLTAILGRRPVGKKNGRKTHGGNEEAGIAL